MEASAGYDVVVIGGGPAGCATAMALRRYGIPRILVVESSRYQATRIGESIPPDTRILLEQLGIWSDFLKEQHDACLGSCASWGDDALGYNDFLFNPHGQGWHLDRARFDLFLARKTVESGAEVSTGTRFANSSRVADRGFHLRLTEGERQTRTVHARFVVDATGMQARFARSLGAKRVFLDRLICVAGYFQLPDSSQFSRLTMLEAVEYGWWYAARLPNGRLTAAVASDAEFIRALALNKKDSWLAWLSETRHISRKLADCPFIEGSLRVCTAPSFLLEKATGNCWLAVGDAASAYDPISSQGIYKALSDGLQAAAVIASCLQGQTEKLRDYEASLGSRFNAYLANRNYFYGMERRWPGAPFWSRRVERNAVIKQR
jgi:flavin-dependent dehydrogenase